MSINSSVRITIYQRQAHAIGEPALYPSASGSSSLRGLYTELRPETNAPAKDRNSEDNCVEHDPSILDVCNAMDVILLHDISEALSRGPTWEDGAVHSGHIAAHAPVYLLKLLVVPVAPRP